MALILVRATVTAEGYCAGWVGYVDDTDPAVQELIAGGYLSTDVTVLPPPTELCCLPPGGTTNQILAKVSNLDRDANWQNAPPSLPSGPASGVLSGTYPNPIFAEDMATQIELDAAIAAVPEQAQDAVAAMIAAGTQTGLSASYNDAAGSLSFTVPAGYTDEQAQDATAAMIAAGTQTGITFTYNDAAGTLSATVTGAPPSGTAGGVLTGSYPNPSFAASPAFTGNPTAPTPAVGDNDTSIATTAFVRSAVNFVTPESLGAAGNGIRDDWVEVQAAFNLGVPLQLIGTYYVSKPIEWLNRNTSLHPTGGSNRPSFRCHSSWNAADKQLLRNWSDSDWTVGETDHRKAPNSKTYAIASPSTHNYYPRIDGGQLLLDPQNATNVALFSWAGPQERFQVNGLRLVGGNGADVNKGTWGVDLQGNVIGTQMQDLIFYGTGYERQISIDCAGGSGANVYFDRVTFSPCKTWHSKLFVLNVVDFVMREWHMESAGGIDAASLGWMVLQSHTGFGSYSIEDGDFLINDGGTTSKPVIKAWADNSISTLLSPPLVTRLKINNFSGTFNGNLIEDRWMTIPRNGALQILGVSTGHSVVNMTQLQYYDGNIVSWANADGTIDTFSARYASLVPVTLTYGASVSTNRSLGSVFKITATNTSAFTINAPTNMRSGDELVYDITNSSGGTMGTITWNAAFLLAGAFTNPASTKRRTIRFYYDGTNWVELNRAAADI
jgi:hypothetical protein